MERERMPIQKRRSREEIEVVGAIMVDGGRGFLDARVLVEGELRMWVVTLKFAGWRRVEDIRF
jgi:hypothetical protein